MIPNDQQNIVNVELEQEMKKSFIDYAMSVIVDRALPDVRDGMKPVHRRILYSMYEQGYTPDKPYKKSVSTVGEVMKKYHPHGDAAIYDTMVRMAQPFSLRHMLIDGHGNFGSVDGDPPAAMRYTEAKLAKIALEMVRDIDKETVDFIPNFDNTEKEPVALPSRFPNLLVNGSSGIAVGMTTNIPPHNLGEVIDGVIKVIDDDDVSIDDLMKIIKGPDFPTGAEIVGRDGIKDMYTKGRGRIIVRAVSEIEEMSNSRQRIIITELPYQVNKANLIEKIADLVKEKRIEGISDIRDESDRDGMRVVIELKRDANANLILNQLYKHTQLQDTFSAIMLALVDGEPKVLTLRDFIDRYLEHQRSVIYRRTQFELKKAEARAHILEGLKIAIDNIDEVIRIIRSAYDDAKEKLMETFGLSDIQAQAILDMRLRTLQGLQREKIEEEYQALLKEIERLKEILGSEVILFNVIKEELLEIKQKYADERRTKFIQGEGDFEAEDLIEDTESVITLTHFGYIKRLAADTYKKQNRGGKGIAALTTREEDFVEKVFIASAHQYISFFTNLGKVYRLKAYEIPEAGRTAKGTAIVNLLQLQPGEKVQAVIPIPMGEEEEKGKFILMGTESGIVKKVSLEEFRNVRRNGIIAITIKEGDRLVDVKFTDGNCDVMLATQNGIAIRFKEDDVRATGRTSMGVKGITLNADDKVVGMEIIPQGQKQSYLLAVSENGFGKRTDVSEYKVQSRAGKGILTYNITKKTGKLCGVKVVGDTEDIMLISSDGTIIRLNVESATVLGRSTQGVTLIRMKDDVKVVSIAVVEEKEDIE